MMETVDKDQFSSLFVGEEPDLQITCKNGNFYIEVIVRQIRDFLQVQEIGSFGISPQFIKSRIENAYFVLG
jgi:hypothetical protein